MATIEATLRTFFKTFDRLDFKSAMKMVDAAAEGSDELTKKWIRGKRAFEAYMKRVGPEIQSIVSRFSSVRTRRLGRVGLATYNMKQSYTLSGKRHTYDFVGSAVFVKRGADWKVTLVHLTPVGGG